MSMVCTQCHRELPAGSEICERCGTLAKTNRVFELLASWRLFEKIEELRRELTTVDKGHLSIVFSVAVGIGLTSLSLLETIGSAQPMTGSVILRLLAQLVFASAVAYFPISYGLQGDWPLAKHVRPLLGSSTSFSRVLFYSLLIQLALMVLFTLVPSASELLEWLGLWLLGALFWLFPVGFWLTGALPLAGPVNAILGDETSLRRRLIFAAVLTLPLLSFPPRLLLIVFGVMFHLMGFTTNWRPIVVLHSYIVLDDMKDRVSMVAESIHRRMTQREVPRLKFTDIDLARTDLFIARQANVEHGHEFTYTFDRARLTLFIRNYGNDLFARWIVHCDLSGRRLWLLIGSVISLLDKTTIRWLGTSFLDYTSFLRSTLLPASGANQEADPIGTFIFRVLGLVETLPEQALNDLHALEGAVRNTVTEALRQALASKGRDDDVASMFRAQLEKENNLRKLPTSPSASFSPSTARS